MIIAIQISSCKMYYEFRAPPYPRDEELARNLDMHINEQILDIEPKIIGCQSEWRLPLADGSIWQHFLANFLQVYTFSRSLGVTDTQRAVANICK